MRQPPRVRLQARRSAGAKVKEAGKYRITWLEASDRAANFHDRAREIAAHDGRQLELRTV